ncbi:MAG: peptidylprolyl isomerase [Chloroflexota bacterium]
MAKKGTTGGPRTRRVTQEDLKRRHEYRSRAERDRMWQRRILIVTAVLIGLSVVVLVGALFYEQVIRPGQAISKVNGDEIATRDFEDRVRLMRWLTAEQIREFYFLTGGNLETIQQYASQQINDLRRPQIIGSQVLDEMEEELVIKQAAAAMGITVDEAAVDAQVDDYMAQTLGLTLPSDETATPTTAPTITPTPLVSPTPSNTPRPTETATPLPTATPGPTATPTGTPTETPIPSPTATWEPTVIAATLESATGDFFQDAKKAVGADREAVRQLFYYDALRTAVLEELTKDLPTEELQVNARHILLSFNPDLPAGQTLPPTDEEKAAALARAEAAMAALQDGEPFADLAKAISDDTSAASGGELGWSSPDSFVSAFKDAVLNATIGEVIGPIETEYGYHIIQVHAREIRPLTDSELNTRRQETFTTWLDEQKAAATIERRDDWLDRIPEDPSYNSLLGDILPLG